MFWLVTGAVAVVLFALAWWSSGRAKPGRIEHHQPTTQELYQVIRDHRPSDGGGSGLV
jgi:hypothetical protein